MSVSSAVATVLAGERYLSQIVAEEFVGVEAARSVTERAMTFSVVLRPPRPSSSFQIGEGVIEDAQTHVMQDIVTREVLKHASELRWNCIETMLRADIEAGRLDRARMVQFLEKTLDDAQREQLALDLMAKVERLGWR